MPEPKRPLKVFLCHAHADRDSVRTLYSRLTRDGVDAWLDKEKLFPGQNFEHEIRKAVHKSDVVIVCLSKEFNRAGFRQKEVKWALDAAMRQPEGEVFIIPLRLEECETLDSLRELHWVDYFEDNGYEKILNSLEARAKNIGSDVATILKKNAETESPNPGIQEVEVKKNSTIIKFRLAIVFLLSVFVYFASVFFLPNKNIADVTQTPYIIYVYVTQGAIQTTQTTHQTALCDAIVVTSTDSSKGVELEIKDCEGRTYVIGPLPSGVYKLSPNQKFIVYVASDNDGSVFISKIGSSSMVFIGSLRRDYKFKTFLYNESPSYSLSLTDTLLTIYEANFQDTASYVIPNSYSR